MENSWIFSELNGMKSAIERMINHALERVTDNPRWEQVADDLIDAKEKLTAALKVKEGANT